MIRKLYNILSLTLIIGSPLLLNNVFWQFWQFELWNTSTILNTDINNAVNTDVWNSSIWDPLRQWAYQIVSSDDWNYTLNGIVDNDSEITQHSTALNRTLWIINNIINWALGMLSLIALVYLIVHGFIIITAAWDETKYKKWLKWIKYATIAIVWIWLSWFIISWIFRIIEGITTGT
jgi:hypothetical protein